MTAKLNYAKANPGQVVEAIGHTLGRIRIAQNLTQAALAARAGITEKTLRNVEKGEGATLNTLIRLMQALGLGSHLENLLPDPGIQPVDQVKRQGRERQRASRSTTKKPATTWSWDQEETP